MVRGREVWEPRVRRLEESDLTVAEFAAELGVNPNTLSYWKWRLGKEARDGRKRSAASQTKPRFVEVKPPEPSPVSAPERIEIVLEGGMLVRVPAAFEPETLRRVISALAETA